MRSRILSFLATFTLPLGLCTVMVYPSSLLYPVYLLTVETHSHTPSTPFHVVSVVRHVEILSKEKTSSLLIREDCVKIVTCLMEGWRLLRWEMND